MSLSELENEKAREIWAKSSQRDSNKEEESPYFLKDIEKKESSSRSVTKIAGSGASSLYLKSRHLPDELDTEEARPSMLKEDSMFSNDLLTKIDSKHPSKQVLISNSELQIRR